MRRRSRPLARFRGYRETERSEPLDLVVVSSYRGMAGMDLANEALRRPSASGQSALWLYGTLTEMTVAHHDQFVEIIPRLTVFEDLRLAPGAEEGFQPLLARQVRRFEQNRKLVQWSETGRMLVRDGWDYLRIFNIRSLAVR